MINQYIDELMATLNKINELPLSDLPSKHEILLNNSTKILVKELHLCILRHSYRNDNIRHNYNEIINENDENND